MDDRFVPVAEVVKAVGLKGEVKLYPLLDFHEPLLEGDHLVWGDGTPAAVTRHRPASGGTVVITIAGCRDRAGAEALVGRELGFRRGDYLRRDFPRPAAGLPFRYLERPVVTADGRRVGTVDEVRRAGGTLLLVVPGNGGEILIPAVEPILRPDDGLEGELVVDPPEGLLDVNRG
jgi:16S rRNA processing protein RimM